MIRIGPAGWSYPDWEGIVYPRRKPRGFHPLPFLARYFDCVEINSSFYGVPSARNAERWVGLVADRPRFRFTAKLQDVFTHRPLPASEDERAEAVGEFTAGLAPLSASGKLAAVLVQFPWSFQRDERGEERLSWIAEHFGPTSTTRWPLVLELRHRSWFEPGPLARVRELGYTLAGIDLPLEADRPSEEDLVGIGDRLAPRSMAYLRLHGRNAEAWFDTRAGRDQKYDYRYDQEEVRQIVRATRRLAQGADETYVITNNHFSGKAIATALDLLAELSGDVVLGPVELLQTYPDLRERVRPDGQDSLF